MTELQTFLKLASRRTCTMRSTIFTCILIVFVNLGNVSSDQGRVPPMVAPNHYDNVQNPNYQHPPPAGVPPGQAQGFGGQQKPVQYAQEYQQAPPHSPHHGTGHEQTVLHAADMQHEKEHIAEHMDVPIDTSKMSEQELQFHYFKMHDNDNNNMLDGTELIKSLIHWHETGHEAPQAQHAQQKPQPKLFSDEELIQLIDPILKMDDLNLDGYIDYPEFVRAQQKSAAGT